MALKSLAVLVAAVVTVVVFPSSASPRTASTAWRFHWSGRTFGGTYTNPTASVVNGVSIGTGEKAKNPIVSFTFASRHCGLYAPYGSAYCYTGISVAPGKSVTFSGTTKLPVGKAGFQACDTADRGANNTCIDVTLQSAAPAVNQADVKELLRILPLVISDEEDAIKQLTKGYSRPAKTDLDYGILMLHASIQYTKTLPPSVGADIDAAATFDEQARTLFVGKPAGRKTAIAKLEDGLVDKKAALQTVNDAKR